MDTAHLPHSSIAVEPEAVGGSKHQTESSVDRQLPVGDVYSPKLPCAFATSSSGGQVVDDINIRRRTPKLRTLSFLNVDISIVHAESCAGSFLQV